MYCPLLHKLHQDCTVINIIRTPESNLSKEFNTEARINRSAGHKTPPCHGLSLAVLASQKHRFNFCGQGGPRSDLSQSLSLSLEGSLMGTVQSGVLIIGTHYSEVKIKGLLKYKLPLLNNFIFVTTSYIRFQSM